MDIFKMQGPFPKNCVSSTCKAPFYKEDIKGHIPHFAITTLVFCKCHKCGAVHKVKIPVVYVEQWIDSLPDTPPISYEELADFQKNINSPAFFQSLRKEADNIELIYEDMMDENDDLYDAMEDELDEDDLDDEENSR